MFLERKKKQVKFSPSCTFFIFICLSFAIHTILKMMPFKGYLYIQLNITIHGYISKSI